MSILVWTEGPTVRSEREEVAGLQTQMDAQTVLDEIQQQAEVLRQRGEVPEWVELGPAPYRALEEHFGPVATVLGLEVRPGGHRGRVCVRVSDEE